MAESPERNEDSVRVAFPYKSRGSPSLRFPNMSTIANCSQLPTFLEECLPQIREACRKFYVQRLYLYGSAVTDDFRPEESDLDFLVDFLPEARKHYHGSSKHHLYGTPDGPQYPANYRALAFALRELLPDCSRIDIGTYGCIDNEYFKKAVDAHKVELYASP